MKLRDASELYLGALIMLALAGCSGSAVLARHTSNAAVAGVNLSDIGDCDVSQEYAAWGRWQEWRHERGTTRVYGTIGIKQTHQCRTVDRDGRDVSLGTELLVIREFDRR